ncbi:M14 family metallopeptidase [Chitinimonas viridis]|uniref:M14 family metallopeptidase n=1 Tax=Chitinimonas viridis TaxID=664880 RepID=A0ABT8B608_9NEIS|nr:M14 family metallopeptidase [Chitinimonas viridis]MDN3577212.1 M14 family metallopeptidase [Chitinimonas viridis]
MSYKNIACVAAVLACAAPLASAHDSAAMGQGLRVLDMLEEDKSAGNVYEAHFPSLELARKAAITFHHAVLEANYESGFLVMELNREDIGKLRQFGFRIKPAERFMSQRKQVLGQVQNLMRQRMAKGQPADDVNLFAIPGYSCYETVEETFTAAQGFVASKPTLASWSDIGDSWQKKNGLGGYDMRVLKLTNSAMTGSKPKLFINSAIHAREYTTAPLVLEFARWLVNGYGTNADATWLLDHHEIHMLLHTNPDGRKRAETGLSWRKNTNQAYCGATSNSRGADLNRNFTHSWNSTGGTGSSGSQCNDTYRGPAPASEPETQAIEAYVRTLWPDSRGPNVGDAAPATTSGIHLDIHSYSQLVLWPWGDRSSAAPNGTALQTLGRKFAYFNNYTPQQSVGLYPTDGTSDAISYGELGVAAFTFELGTSFFQSCTTFNSTIKPQNLQALIYAAKVVRTPYITPAGPDVTTVALSGTAATTGVPRGTQVTLTGSATDIRFRNSNGTEATQNIAAAEYYIDTPPWAPGAVPLAMTATDGSFNAKTEGIRATISTSSLSLGKHLVYVRSRDASGSWGAVTATFLQLN